MARPGARTPLDGSPSGRNLLGLETATSRHQRPQGLPQRSILTAAATLTASALAVLCFHGLPGGHASPDALISPAQAHIHAQVRTVPNAAALPDTLAWRPHPVPPPPPPVTWTIGPGDSLTSVAAHEYGAAADWPVIYWANRAEIRWASQLPDGLVLVIPTLPAVIPAAPAQLAPTAPPGPAPTSTPGTSSSPAPGPSPSQPAPSGSGQLTPAQVGAYWLAAGGPAWAEQASETVAMCESGDNTNAYNPSGASGLWQILGQVVPGNIFDPMVNALNAVSKFNASGQTWSQWTCRP